MANIKERIKFYFISDQSYHQIGMDHWKTKSVIYLKNGGNFFTPQDASTQWLHYLTCKKIGARFVPMVDNPDFSLMNPCLEKKWVQADIPVSLVASIEPLTKKQATDSKAFNDIKCDKYAE